MPGKRLPRPGAGRGLANPVNRLVGKVLSGNGITRTGNSAIFMLGGDELSDKGNVSGREWGSGAIKRKQRY